LNGECASTVVMLFQNQPIYLNQTEMFEK